MNIVFLRRGHRFEENLKKGIQQLHFLTEDYWIMNPSKNPEDMVKFIATDDDVGGIIGLIGKPRFEMPRSIPLFEYICINEQKDHRYSLKQNVEKPICFGQLPVTCCCIGDYEEKHRRLYTKLLKAVIFDGILSLLRRNFDDTRLRMIQTGLVIENPYSKINYAQTLPVSFFAEDEIVMDLKEATRHIWNAGFRQGVYCTKDDLYTNEKDKRLQVLHNLGHKVIVCPSASVEFCLSYIGSFRDIAFVHFLEIKVAPRYYPNAYRIPQPTHNRVTIVHR